MRRLPILTAIAYAGVCAVVAIVLHELRLAVQQARMLDEQMEEDHAALVKELIKARQPFNPFDYGEE